MQEKDKRIHRGKENEKKKSNNNILNLKIGYDIFV